MLLIDTSVWIEHFRVGDTLLAELLNAGEVIAHPFVIGELACGNLKDRATVLTLLQGLPQAPVAEADEVLLFIEQRSLMGKGIGYVDAHLLAATALMPMARLWTYHRRLNTIARSIGLNFRTRSF